MGHTNPKRLTIYQGEPLRWYYDTRPEIPMHRRTPSGKISPSETINRLVERYRWGIQRDFPLLSESEWAEMGTALMGNTEMTLDDIEMLEGMIFDDLYPDEVSADGIPPLVKKLQSFSYTQWLGIVEVIERLWGNASNERSLRKCVSYVSGRPSRCVFIEDPEPWDTAFWFIVDDTTGSLNNRVVSIAHIDHKNHPMRFSVMNSHSGSLRLIPYNDHIDLLEVGIADPRIGLERTAGRAVFNLLSGSAEDKDPDSSTTGGSG